MKHRLKFGLAIALLMASASYLNAMEEGKKGDQELKNETSVTLDYNVPEASNKKRSASDNDNNNNNVDETRCAKIQKLQAVLKDDSSLAKLTVTQAVLKNQKFQSIEQVCITSPASTVPASRASSVMTLRLESSLGNMKRSDEHWLCIYNDTNAAPNNITHFDVTFP